MEALYKQLQTLRSLLNDSDDSLLFIKYFTDGSGSLYRDSELNNLLSWGKETTISQIQSLIDKKIEEIKTEKPSKTWEIISVTGDQRIIKHIEYNVFTFAYSGKFSIYDLNMLINSLSRFKISRIKIGYNEFYIDDLKKLQEELQMFLNELKN